MGRERRRDWFKYADDYHTNLQFAECNPLAAHPVPQRRGGEIEEEAKPRFMTAFYDRNKLYNEGKAGLERWKRAKSGNSAFDFSSKFLKSQIWMNSSRVYNTVLSRVRMKYFAGSRKLSTVGSSLFGNRSQERPD